MKLWSIPVSLLQSRELIPNDTLEHRTNQGVLVRLKMMMMMVMMMMMMVMMMIILVWLKEQFIENSPQETSTRGEHEMRWLNSFVLHQFYSFGAGMANIIITVGGQF